MTENESYDKEDKISTLYDLSQNAKDFYLPREVPVLNEIPQPLDFFRNWVSTNIPFIVKGGIKDWPAVRKWNKSYFFQTLKDKRISVAVTPNGYADAVADAVIDGNTIRCFVLPEERTMLFGDFLKKLNGEMKFTDSAVGLSKGIFYIQKQDSNLTEEFPELVPDIDENLTWASEAFNSKPAAINLWMGDKRAVSSLHKDPFENIYCVISGYKDFILIPPTDRPWLPYREFPVAQYKEISPGQFQTTLVTSNKWVRSTASDDFEIHKNDQESDSVPWIDIDPLNPDRCKYPLYSNVTPFKLRVESGDVLYLPSLWFHHVSQSQGCIAVNYWYDMSFDIKFAYFQLLEKLSPQY